MYGVLYNNMACPRAMRRNNFLLGFLLLTVFGSNTRMAPDPFTFIHPKNFDVAAGNFKIFEHGSGHVYRYTSTVTLNEPFGRAGKDVGYQVEADVRIGVVWQSPENKNDKLLEFQVANPRLLIRSRKAPAPDGFVVHTSNLETAANSPFAVRWLGGRVTDLHVDAKEDVSLVNIKRGISSLFQFQLLDMETKETDASGDCLVVYRTIDSYSFTKTKTECYRSKDAPDRRPVDQILGVNVNSSRVATYVLSRDLSFFESVTTKESHEMRVAVKRDVGGSVSAEQKLLITDAKTKVDVLKSRDASQALKEFAKSRRLSLEQHRFHPEVYDTKCDKDECPSLPRMVKENRENLVASNLGTLKSATAFLKVLSVARDATKEDLAKAFKGKKNKEILAQLCDLAGAIQTPESHEVIMKLLNFDEGEDLDNAERYLWSLSVGSHPNEHILKDIYERSKKPYPNGKLSETLILTLASMTNKYYKMNGSDKVGLAKDITQFIVKGLESCKDDECKHKYLRALKNLKCPRTLPKLIDHALNGRKSVSVGAMKALRSFDPSHWSGDVIDAAQRIYFQAGRRYDSSSRTLALDILLESRPSRDILRELLVSLTHRDKAFEVKQYLVQRIRQISEKCPKFARTVESILKESRDLFNNYHVKAQRGLTTAFTRTVTASEYRNASLVSVQEIYGGFLKRGLVDVIIETPDQTTSLFTLGLFAGGLSSFVSSGDKDKDDAPEEEESATAGMELTVLGTQLRPFVFFSGQGELMGHVWSGTASEKTPAYQALIVTQDQLEYIPLQNGLVSRVQLLGVVSFDLSGQVQMSLWNRNAHSLVEKNAGIYVQGGISVDASFVRSKVEFNVATEVRLNLQSDLNFYNEISLCMQLSQPESVIKHNVHKIERITGSKHRLRKSKYKQTTVPGRTYALNRKNNEMCNLIFKDK